MKQVISTRHGSCRSAEPERPRHRHDDARLPLVVDLDGTLTATDTLIESIVRLVRRNPAWLLRLPCWLASGPAAFKEQVARHVDFRADAIPYRSALLRYVEAEKRHGTRIILATAAHRSIAQQVSSHLGLFDDVIATEHGVNLKGAAKLARIRSVAGDDFIYAGDSKADLPIWAAARRAILVGAASGVVSTVRRITHVEREFPADPAGVRVWLGALRIHQWLKNLLLFVPLLTAFAFADIDAWLTLLVAFVSLSFGASATYIANDLWDLDNDRRHPRKCGRPFASGALPISKGVAVAACLLSISLALGGLVSATFLSFLVLYLVLTTVYSWNLKSRVLLDVIVLSLLYTLRVVAGSVTVGIRLSGWLLMFSVLTFFSLALVKRCAELVATREIGRTAAAGRDYRTDDLEVLWPLGIGASLAAVVVFGLFINAPETLVHYTLPQLLWLVQIGLIDLFGRLWIMTRRGAMHDDPIVHLLENRGSFLAIAAMLALMLGAHFIPSPDSVR